MPLLLARAARMGKSVYLFGGKPGTADAAANTLIHKIPNLRIAGARDGYGGAADAEAAIADINDSGADIVLVAMGVPMQEIWLHENAHRLDAPLTLGVGALFDFLAGTVVRAPKIVRKARHGMGLASGMEPRRMAKRYLAGNVSFLAHAVKTLVMQTPFADVQRRFLDVTVSASALVVLSPVALAGS